MTDDSRRAVILGAGLTGLTAAVSLRRRGVPVTVLESGARAGGPVASEESGGFLVERGPNSMMTGEPEVLQFLADIGLADEMIAPLAKKRFLVSRGHPQALPQSFFAALTTPLFSFGGKLRVLREPFVPRVAAEDESLASFVRRRLGPEILARAVEPFVAGIYAGDPEMLSARQAFPRLWNLEHAHGSLLRGALRARGGLRPRAFSFKGGMGSLPDKMASLLGGDLHCGSRVRSIAREGRSWLVEWSDGVASHRVCAAELICAVPALVAASLPWPDEIRPALVGLEAVPYPPVTIVALGFRRADVAHALDGFGMLVPSAERRKILGTIFSSSLFPGRAPEDRVMLTTFVGGARQPSIAQMEDGPLEQAVVSDLADLVGVRGEPVFRRIIRWPRAIPQYNLGHERIIRALEKLEAASPGLHLVGNYRGGIAAGQCIHNGLRLAETMTNFNPNKP
ncbi:MAG: protoporphyrinogen oxidase [Chthoniobacterales bacterium]|nr:protoporphyrinogen oxidase [Chthoniobacterales bacterium]